MIFGVFVPMAEIVPAEVAWFWEAVEVGQVPWLWADSDAAVLGCYDADVEETPLILCPDDDVRIGWTIGLLEGARDLPLDG